MPETDTLYCELGKHEWERPRVRGRKPKSCPQHQPETPVRRAPNPTAAAQAEAPSQEAYDAAYNTGLSPRVCAAFLAAGITPPMRERVDMIGYNAAEVRALLAIQTPLPPVEEFEGVT